MNYAHLVSPSSFIKMVLEVQEDDYTWWYVRKFTLRDWCSNHITWVTLSWCWNQGMSHGNVLFDHIPSSMTFKTYAQTSEQTNMTYCTYKAIRDWREISRSNGAPSNSRVRKTLSAMLTGKFLRIRKVFATPESFCKKIIILAEEYPDIWKMSGYYTKYPDNMQSVRMTWKVSRWSQKCWDELESFYMM